MTATEPERKTGRGAGSGRGPSRRRLLAGAGAAAVAAGLLPAGAIAMSRTASRAAHLAAAGELDGRHTLCLLDAAGRVLRQEVLPQRGHGFAFDPARRLLVGFARRPGRFALAVPLDGGPARFFETPPNRHFYGHGCFSPDGRLLYACENDFDAARGAIGIYDATAGFARIGEFDAGGIGPHQVEFLADGRTLAVAVGGIETHPDYGRTKLNLATMEPSAVLLDARDGRILAQDRLPPELHQLSLRHLAVDAWGRVWLGGQHEGPATDLPPLLAVFAEGRLRSVAMAPALSARYRNYVGSVVASGDGRLVATSSPRGSIVTIWDAADARPLASHELADVCGLAAWGRGFLATGGLGDLLHITADGARPLSRLSANWDNHALAL